MREHPVPQDITGYKFHIIGEMTIKQFAMVAGGVFLAFLVKMTNLPAFIKWPTMAILAGVGALAAFVPIEEQPLDHWIITFFKVLYKPTQYYWHRQAKIPEAFKFKQRTEINKADVPADLSPARKERIKEYLFSLDTEKEDEYDLYEQEQIVKLNQSFLGENPTKPVVAKNTFKHQALVDQKNNLIETGLKLSNLPEVNISETTTPPNQVVYKNNSANYNNIVNTQIPNVGLNSQKETVNVSIPDQEVASIAERNTPIQIPTDQGLLDNKSNSQKIIFNQAHGNTKQINKSIASSTHNAQLPFPSKATVPNKIVGMTLSNNNELINDAIIEIKKESGEVLRAVKSNSLGQFFISTPLKNGSYLISAEKNGFSFPQSRLILEGEIIDPIEIKSL